MNPKPTAARNRHVMTEEEIRVQARVSSVFRINYRKARERLGLSMANRRSTPRFSKHTNMSWKFPSFEQNYMWIWEEYIRITETTTTKRALVMAQLISKTFGIALVDIRGKTRDATVVMPRMIGMAMLRHDKLSYGEIRRAFNKDQKTAAYAAEQMSKYTVNLDARVNCRRYSSVSQSTGLVPSQVPEVAEGNSDQAQARSDCADGGFDGGEGQTPRNSCEQGS